MEQTICRVEDCDSAVKVKKDQLCGRHYARLRRHGDPTAWKKTQRVTCSVSDCQRKAAALGLCDTHYRRQKRYGTTDLPERPTVCVVDGCGRSVDSSALCNRHYRRAHRGGSIERHCRFCGSLLDPNEHGRKRYCGKECHEQAMYLKRKEDNRRRQLRLYGLTPEQFDEMLAAQGGGCAICGTTEPGGNGQRFHVDHCHDTSEVRGILCYHCNVGIGHFRDDPRLLEAALGYLRRDRLT